MALKRLKKIGLHIVRGPAGTEYECHGCGYVWGSKKEGDPPTRCPRCNSLLSAISVW